MAEFLLPEGNWHPVPGFEGLYVVSDDGRVHSLPRTTTKGRILKQRHDPGGYLQVTFSKDGHHTHHRVHILVLTAFRGACPPGHEGAHDDGDKENCRLDNLFWKTRSANKYDTVRHGHHYNGSKDCCRWGHKFTKRNTRITAQNRRVCKTCDNTRHCDRPGCQLPTHDHAGTPWLVAAS